MVPIGQREREHRIGRDSPHAVIRVLEGLEGEVEMELEFQPRPEYGLTTPMLLPHPGGMRTRGGPRAYVLASEIPLEAGDGIARARFAVQSGRKVAFAMRACSPWEDLEAAWTPDEILRRLEKTIDAWRSWSGMHEGYRGPYQQMVRHSGRVLQALTYSPTGGVIAAPTTSLPETIGGTRNWDYRFCWVRDASLTLEALWVAACPDEAREFFDFFVTAAGGHVDGGRALQVLYGVGGERHLPEQELGHLSGHRGSRPVRIGNTAWSQTQLDIYGDLLSAADLLADRIGDFDEVTSDFLCYLADVAAQRWEEPDQGIWEIRGGPRHFLYSKLMCWAALDRAVRLAPRLGREAEVPRWSEVRDRIREAILERGWSDRAGAYTQAFGSDDLFGPDDAHRGLPPGRRSADAGHHRGHRRTADRRARARVPVPITGRPSPARRGSSESVPTGWFSAGPCWARSAAPGRCSRPSLRMPTTWGCCPRRSTPPPVSRSGIFLRRSPTSG
jgi:hypothetical protein